MIYQISYVVRGDKTAGRIEQRSHYPKLGEVINLKGRIYRIIHVENLIPPLAKFCYVHVLCEPA